MWNKLQRAAAGAASKKQITKIRLRYLKAKKIFDGRLQRWLAITAGNRAAQASHLQGCLRRLQPARVPCTERTACRRQIVAAGGEERTRVKGNYLHRNVQFLCAEVLVLKWGIPGAALSPHRALLTSAEFCKGAGLSPQGWCLNDHISLQLRGPE